MERDDYRLRCRDCSCIEVDQSLGVGGGGCFELDTIGEDTLVRVRVKVRVRVRVRVRAMVWTTIGITLGWETICTVSYPRIELGDGGL